MGVGSNLSCNNPPLKAIMFLIGFICYDDACHLKRFARDPMWAGITDQGKQPASVEMVVDKMHMKGHVDPWCKMNCDAEIFSELDKVLL